MIQIYADGALAYDSRLESHDLVDLKVTSGLNVGGTAIITMPRNHPAYNSFTSYRTIVTIYRDGVLRFRGRALYPADTSLGQRTITCEGELCLLGDGIHRPYLYTDTPQAIFAAVVQDYNNQMIGYNFKHFQVGEVTVTDPNDYIRLESESAETHQATINKLLERCGGYIVFSDGTDGVRKINWYATLDRKSSQQIEFGENLLDFTSTGANNTDLATSIIPFGAKDSTTGKRITIESINGGVDYITDVEAKARFGNIVTTVTWDDVTEPANLLKKAQAYLEGSKQLITSLELSALDLSYMDKDLDSFTVGDYIRVISIPHGVNEDFQLTQMTEDLLNPAQSRIILGKDIPSLTGADVAGDAKGQSAVASAKNEIQQNVSSEMQQAATQLEQTVTPQVAQAVLDQVSTLYLPISILTGKVDLSDEAILFFKEIRFLNQSGVCIAKADGSFGYVLQMDASNNCVVGNDCGNLRLRCKDAAYLHKAVVAVTADSRKENGAETLPEAYMTVLDKLTPVRFKYNDTDERYHVGFVAQDVETALIEAGLTRDDFGGFVDVAGDGSELGLAYDEFIGLLLEKIRRLEQRIDEKEE